MNILLDTHIFLWWSIQPEKLSTSASGFLHDVDNNLFLSIASIWEIQIKHQIGKLSLTVPLPELVQGQRDANELNILPIELNHVYRLKELPDYHRDPFDRIIIAQAIFEQMPLLSVDGAIDAYPVQKIW